MRLLLDTHALLWWLADMPQLGAFAQASIERGDNNVIVSAASAWEIEIKRAVGKLKAPNDLATAIEAAGFETLPITMEHAVTAGRLPRHHDDPFDRMLIAQALVEPLTIISKDSAFRSYGVALIAADA
ncbi:MAG: type II toxin-antitoxin system VapC family toxin [Nitrosospira sp.]|nr:type II toxin-antitoxin system VapC family toxin [Nitrosospira sp.]